MTITSSDVLEFVKIVIIIIVGAMLIGALFMVGLGEPETAKCICECVDGVIKL